MEWQPIKTAPRDGTAVLVFVPSNTRKISIAAYLSDAKKPYWNRYGWLVRQSKEMKPTHWMPLPGPPK